MSCSDWYRTSSLSSTCSTCSGGPQLKHFVGKNLAMVYCDSKDSPLVWDFRMRRCIKKARNVDVFVFVGHWSQSCQIEFMMKTYPPNQVHMILIDRCCKWWFDTRKVQDIVIVAKNVQIVDEPVLLSEIIRNRARYPFHDTCRC